MTALLYYSISSTLTEDEIIEVDRRVAKDREEVYIFVRNFAANRRTKRIILIIALASGVWFSNLESAEAIGLSMPSAPVVRVQPSFEDSLKKPEFAKLIPRKPDRISYKYFSRSKEELLLLIYATDPRLASNQQILKLVKDLRGGSWGLVGTAALLGFMILIFSIGEGFVPNPGWGLDRPNPFQPPSAPHKFPPYYDFLFPRRTCYADRPGGSQIMAAGNPQSSREELTQLSTDVVSTQTQVSGFVKNGKVDLNQAFNEVNRRASAIGCETFDCSFDRFKELATECGETKESGVREAITILQGEMQGYYKNAPNSVGRILEFAEIFSRYGFNSKIFYVATNESKTIFEDKKFYNTLTFRLESDSWNKEIVLIQFSGLNSRRLYFLITNGYFAISLLITNIPEHIKYALSGS
jgi:hypothetical protein